MDGREEVQRLLADARASLPRAPREALGVRTVPRRILGIPRAERIVPDGEAWHLGVLLLADDAVLATGDIVRARAEAIRGFPAESQRARAAVAAAASRGGFADGRIVHVGAREIDLETLDEHSEPLAIRSGDPVVRWSAAGGYLPLAAYLAERIELLQHPPERA